MISVYLLLRSRLGLVLTAVRDNEIGARSVGSRVMAAKRVVYVLAAAGCAGAGAIIAISQLDVEPGNVFNVQWTAYMIFAVLIGGLGTIEGPVIGSVVFFVLQQTLANYDVWYLIILGTVAMAMAIWARRGLWGLFTAKVPVHLFPVGYYVHIGRRACRNGEVCPASCWGRPSVRPTITTTHKTGGTMTTERAVAHRGRGSARHRAGSAPPTSTLTAGR